VSYAAIVIANIQSKIETILLATSKKPVGKQPYMDNVLTFQVSTQGIFCPDTIDSYWMKSFTIITNCGPRGKKWILNH
jgi:hypothetical protein